MAFGRVWVAVAALFTLSAQAPDSIAARALGQALLAIGRMEAQSGDKPRAKQTFSAAASLFHQHNDAAGESDALYGVARQEFDLNEIPAAISNYEKSAELKRQGGDRFGQALTIHNLAAALSETGETARALDYYRQALEIRRAIADGPGIGYSLYGIATIYWARADMEQALDTYKAALENWRVLCDQSGEANTLNSMGLAYQALGDHPAAADAYRASLELWHGLKNSGGEAYTLNNIGLAHAGRGRLSPALASYQKALVLLLQAHDIRGQAYVLHNLADLEVLRGYRTIATGLYEESLALKRKIGDRYGEAYTLQKIGEGRQSAGDVAAAMALYNQALALHRHVGDRAGEGAALAALARAEDALGDLPQARQRMLEAIRLVERLRIQVSSDELRASYFATQQDYYEYLIGLLMRMHGGAPSEGFDREALEFSERTRSRVLLEVVADDGGVVARRRREFDSRIHEETAHIRRAAAFGRSTFPSRLDAVLEEYDKAEADQADRGAVRPMATARIQNEVLDSGTLLLEYSLGREVSYAWLVGRDWVVSAQLPPRALVERAAHRYEDALAARTQTADATAAARAERLRRADAALPAAAAALSRLLLSPFESRLGRCRLLIVPDGFLHAVPFAALPLASGEALLARHELVRLPSASLAAALRIPQPTQTSKLTAAGPPVAILADPVFGCDDFRAAVTNSPRPPCTAPALFPRLRFSRVEAESIAAMAPGSVVALDFDAARSALERPDFRHARILHFATHVVIDDERSSRSGVVLSLFDRDGKPIEGFLRLSDISGLNLEASTVVLSACRTALGAPVRGEGLVGVARSFFLAGASRVVASLWDVQDRATADLMREFYRGLLQRGRPAAAALRAAQLAVRSNPGSSHPYYWAGFVTTGDWRP